MRENEEREGETRKRGKGQRGQLRET